MRSTRHGFSIIELLTLISIIAILAATVLATNLFGARRNAIDTRTLACARGLKAAQKTHYSRHHTYTSDHSFLDTSYLHACHEIPITDITVLANAEDYSLLLRHPNGATTYRINSQRVHPDNH